MGLTRHPDFLPLGFSLSAIPNRIRALPEFPLSIENQVPLNGGSEGNPKLDVTRFPSKTEAMNNPYKKINQSGISLGELVAAVSSCARNERETMAALMDLFSSGRVRVKDHGHLKRVRLSRR